MNMIELKFCYSIIIDQGVDYEKIDLKSLLIGVLLTMLVFSTLGLRSKTDELGHLVVRSLTIEDDRGDNGLFRKWLYANIQSIR